MRTYLTINRVFKSFCCAICGGYICWATATKGKGICRSCSMKDEGNHGYKHGDKKICEGCGNEMCYRAKLNFCKSCCALGERNPNYIDGRTPEVRRIRNSKEYSEWRIKVFERDNYTCQDCGKVGGTLHAHHIKEFSKYPELRFDVNNGETVCEDCHGEIHPMLKRDN